MFRQLKVWFLTALLVAPVKLAFGFAIMGPGATEPVAVAVPAPDTSWQVEALGYKEVPADPYGQADIDTPRNIAQGYRWNTPVIYWTVDQNFIQYFGTNGQAEVEKAFNIINAVT